MAAISQSDLTVTTTKAKKSLLRPDSLSIQLLSVLFVFGPNAALDGKVEKCGFQVAP